MKYNIDKNKIICFLFFTVAMCSVSMWQYNKLLNKDKYYLTEKEKALKDRWIFFMVISGIASVWLLIVFINLGFNHTIDTIKNRC